MEELVWSGDGLGTGMEPPEKNPTLCPMLVRTIIPRTPTDAWRELFDKYAASCDKMDLVTYCDSVIGFIYATASQFS